MEYTVKPIVCDYAVIRIGSKEIVCIEYTCAYSYDVYPNAKYRVVEEETEKT